MKTDLKKCRELFLTSMVTSLTANSGYAIIASMRSIFVDKHKWLTQEQMNDFIGMGQSAPGMISANIATIIGYEIAGPLGSFSAVMGILIPPIIIMILVTAFYQIITANPYVRVFMEGMSMGVVALLADILTGLFMPFVKEKKVYPFLLILIGFLYIRYVKASVFFLALFCILCGIAKTLLVKKEVKQ